MTTILVQEFAIKKTIDKGQFWDMFKNRAVVVTDLPPGRSRDLANRVNEAEGKGDASLRTKAEYSALFDLLLHDPGSVPTPVELTLLDENGHVTATGRAIEDYFEAGHNGANGSHPSEINRLVDIVNGKKACDTTGTSTNDGYPESAYTLDVANRTAAVLRNLAAPLRCDRRMSDRFPHRTTKVSSSPPRPFP